MNISIIGASGFLGKNLISYLLKNTNHSLCAIAPDPENIIIDDKYKDRVKIMKTDAFDFIQMKIALTGTDVAFYFIHMLNKKNFYDKESMVAQTVGKALKETRVKKVIYMSGLGNDNDNLSEHLLSRHNTGKILREYVDQVIEFRASMIIGKGSASFEIIKDLIHKAPIILLPQKSTNKTQPIRVEDVLLYLSSSIDLLNNDNLIIEIGGPEIMSYQQFLKNYRQFCNKNNPIIVIPFLPEKIAGYFLNFFTSQQCATIGQNMINSFKNEMVVTNNMAKNLFPEVNPEKIDFLALG